MIEAAVTVSQINRYIKNMFVRDYALNRIFVRGEVSNCKYHSSGHIYFTLKDTESALMCVMFASARKGMDFTLQEGQSVIVQGSINVYERDGKYQLYAKKIVREGAGRLYEEYEKLKKRLESEGLFAQENKKKIPKYAKKIGVVTSETGAVIQDICNVSHRRNPYVQIVLYPSKVQGEDAAESVIRGIRYFENTDVDTIIIGRGGGSIEDLWAFNDEKLARQIFACKKPIISAVGHETDTTISDYVADLRVPTPSAAAEMAVFPWRDFEIGLREAAYDMDRVMKQKIYMERMKLSKYMVLLQHASPQDVLNQKRLYLADRQEKMTVLMRQKVSDAKQKLALYAEALRGVSPLYKLQSGYAYIADMDGKHVDSVSQIASGDKLQMTFSDGKAVVKVEKTTQK